MSDEQQSEYVYHSLFPTILVQKDYGDEVKELNRELREAIWRNRALDPEGLYRSNKAGTWHSKDDVFETTGEAGVKLKGMFEQAFAQWMGQHALRPGSRVATKIAGWSMVYSDRGYATVHTHPNCHVSGVYYVDDTLPEQEITMATGVTVQPGDLEFVNPNHREYQVKGVRLNPMAVISGLPGRMLIFPSWLPHFVHPVRGEGERISIAANCTIRGIAHPDQLEKSHDSDK